MGVSRVGEAMSPPLMRAVKRKLQTILQAQPADVVIDAPPGVSCPAVNAVMDADVIALVTEPTPFGLYDLKLAYEAFLPLGKQMGIVVNRAGMGEEKVYGFCRSRNLPIWTEIPYDREIAAAYSQSRIVADVSAHLKARFIELADKISRAAVKTGEVCLA